MGETVSTIFTYINEMLPNSLASTTLYTFFNMESKKYWKYLTNTTVNTTVTATSKTEYDLPTTNVHFFMLKHVWVADSTASSDTIYNEFKFCDSTQGYIGDFYFDARGGKVGLSFSPTSDQDDFPVVFEYQEPPLYIFAASDTTTITNFDDDLTEVIVNNICAKIAKSGKFPRVNLANNFTIEGLRAERLMRIRSDQKKVNTPNIKWDWRDWIR